MSTALQLAQPIEIEKRPPYPSGFARRAEVFLVLDRRTPAPREQANDLRSMGMKRTLKQKDAAHQMIIDHFEVWYVPQAHHYATKRDGLEVYCRLYQSKTLELPADVYRKIKKISVPSVYRWQKQLQELTQDELPVLDQKNLESGGFVMPFKTSLTNIQQSVVLGYYLNQGKLKAATIHRNLVLSGYGEGVAYSAVHRFLTKFNEFNRDVVVLAREGETSFFNKIRGFIERDWNLLRPDELWVADGHRLDVGFRSPKTGKLARATVMAFQDGASRKIVGFSLHWTESTDAVQQALAMALVFSGTPEYILFDNGTGFKNNRMLGQEYDTLRIKGALDYFDIKPIWSIPGNPRSKPIERFFGTLKDQFSRLWSSFTGGAPQWRPEQLEQLEKRDQLPEIADIFPHLLNYFKQHDNTPHSSLPMNIAAGRHATPNEVYGTVEHRTHELDQVKMCMRKAFKQKVSRNGFKVGGPQNGIWYYNPVYVPKLVGNGKAYIIYINDFNGRSVDIHDEQDQFLFRAWPLHALSPLEQLTAKGQQFISDAMHLHGIPHKEADQTTADILARFPEEANIQARLMAVEAKELQAKEEINSLPVDESGSEDGHASDSMYDNDYEPEELDY